MNPSTDRIVPFAPALALSLVLACGALIPQVAHAQTYTLTTLANFNGTNGANPGGGLTLDSGGNFYGTTNAGGTSSDGTVFKIAAGTNTLTTLATFTGTANGTRPYGNLTLDSSGNLYGATFLGGANNDGTVYKIAAGTNVFTTLAVFTGTNGQNPEGGMTFDSSGNLYGTTAHSGAIGAGTVFKIAAGTNTLTTLVTFTGAADGAFPVAGLTLDSNDNLYGTTENAGSGSAGTVFKIAAGANTLTTLANFNGANGGNPFGRVTFDSSGNLYGTTTNGGASGAGTVFRIAAGTNTLTTLVTFTGAANGANPEASLTLDSSGNLYGTTYQGGASGNGTVFKIASGTNALTTLAVFTVSTDGVNPHGDLTLDSSGNLYGTTSSGGASNNGTVFKLSPTVAASAPEPGALALLAMGVLPLAGIAVRRQRKA